MRKDPEKILAALPCSNPFCSINVVLPLSAAIELLCIGVNPMCLMCQKFRDKEIDGEPPKGGLSE